MAKKYVPVRMDGEIFESVKKVALSQGKSVSETVGGLVTKSLGHGVHPGQEIDPEAIRKMIAEAIDPLKTSVAVMRAEIRGIEPVLSREVVRFEVETLAKIESILAAISRDRPEGERKIMDWMQTANKRAKEILRGLQMDKTSNG